MSDAERLVSTKERPGIYDGLETAKPGEPVFVVQGGDLFGPPTVLHWARLAREAGLEEVDEKKSARLLKKATAAEQVAWAMKAYQRGEASLPGRRATYLDSDPDEQAEAARDRRETLIRGADKLYNSLAEALTVGEALAKLREYPDAEAKIREAVDLLNHAADIIEPRRHLQREPK